MRRFIQLEVTVLVCALEAVHKDEKARSADLFHLGERDYLSALLTTFLWVFLTVLWTFLAGVL